MTLRIIVLALALGVIAFAAVAIGQNMNKPHVLAGPLDTQGMVLLGIGLAALPLGIVLPIVIFASSRGSSPVGPFRTSDNARSCPRAVDSAAHSNLHDHRLRPV